MKALDRGQTPYVATPDTTDEVGFVQVDADGVARDARSTFAGIAGAVAATVAVDPSLSSRYVTAVNARGYGAVGDTTTDDTAALQAAITACPEGGTVFIPDGTYTITTALSVTKAMTIVGEGQYTTIIRAVGVSGIIVAQGVTSVKITDLEIARSVRHTTTPNASIGIQVLGVTGSRPRNHVYEDVYIDGFQTAMETNWLWASSFRNFRAGYGQIGLYANGLSVNNMMTHCSIGCDASSGSRGIIIGDGTNATEGWIIGDSLVDSAEIGIEGVGATHCKVHDCIIDHNVNTGVIVRNGTGVMGTNWDIIGNYIAMGPGTGDSGIALNNATANSQNRGCRVIGNLIFVYSGATCSKGIKALAAESKYHTIMGNTIGDSGTGFTTNDIDAAYDHDITIAANMCRSAITNNIAGGTQVASNTGTHYYARAYQRFTYGKITMTYDQAVPTTGTWNRGDVCWNVTASAGGAPGWVCTTAGTPGTWKAMANVVA